MNDNNENFGKPKTDLDKQSTAVDQNSNEFQTVPSTLHTESTSSDLIPGEDYYFDEKGLMVMTRAYHLKRGSCCENGCLNCPFTFRSEDGP